MKNTQTVILLKKFGSVSGKGRYIKITYIPEERDTFQNALFPIKVDMGALGKREKPF